MAQPWLLLSLGASSYLLGVDSFAMGAPVLALHDVHADGAAAAFVVTGSSSSVTDREPWVLRGEEFLRGGDAVAVAVEHTSTSGLPSRTETANVHP